jgi:hypothetical protein
MSTHVGSRRYTFARWVQFVCAIPPLAVGIAVEYYWWQRPWYGAGGLGLIILGGRCLWYAITGKDNVNRDDD